MAKKSPLVCCLVGRRQLCSEFILIRDFVHCGLFWRDRREAFFSPRMTNPESCLSISHMCVDVGGDRQRQAECDFREERLNYPFRPFLGPCFFVSFVASPNDSRAMERSRE